MKMPWGWLLLCGVVVGSTQQREPPTVYSMSNQQEEVKLLTSGAGPMRNATKRVSEFVSHQSSFVSSWSKSFLDFLKQQLLLLLPGRGRLVTRKADAAEEEKVEKPKKLRLSPRIVQFNIMVAGLSGLGKTTACNELFASWRADVRNFMGDARYRPASSRIDRRYGPSAVERLDAHRHVPLEVDDASLASESGPSFFRPSLGRGYERETAEVDDSRSFEYRDSKTNTIIRVTIIDTPGFFGTGPQRRKSSRGLHPKKGVKTILDFTRKRRFDQFRAETKASQSSSEQRSFFSSGRPQSSSSSSGSKKPVDKIVHCCLYFVMPHRFLAIDKYFLKRLQNEVPVVPIIAKSDTLTNSELQEYRHWLNEEFKLNKIDVYSFDFAAKQHSDDDGILRTKNSTSFFEDLAYVPLPRNRNKGDCLAVVGRDGFYPWGSSRAHNPDHSDLNMLRDSLLSEHTEAIVDLAKAKYAVYRERRLKRSAFKNALKSVFVFSAILRAAGITFGLGKTIEPWIADKLANLVASKPNAPKATPQNNNNNNKKTTPRDPSPSSRGSGNPRGETVPPRNDDDDDDLAAKQKRGQQILTAVGTVIGLYLLAPSPF